MKIDDDKTFAFKQELRALLRKWGVTISARDNYDAFDEDGGSMVGTIEVTVYNEDHSIEFDIHDLYHDYS